MVVLVEEPHMLEQQELEQVVKVLQVVLLPQQMVVVAVAVLALLDWLVVQLAVVQGVQV